MGLEDFSKVKNNKRYRLRKKAKKLTRVAQKKILQRESTNA
jgi:hypothetical protein